MSLWSKVTVSYHSLEDRNGPSSAFLGHDVRLYFSLGLWKVGINSVSERQMFYHHKVLSMDDMVGALLIDLRSFYESSKVTWKYSMME